MGKFNKGLNRDTKGADQPAGTWTYAKNALVKRDIGGISNEKGTGTPVPLTSGYTIVGIIEVDENTTIIFSKCFGCGGQGWAGRSEIGIFDHATVENTAGSTMPATESAFGYRAIYNPNPAHEIPTITDPYTDIYYRGVENKLNFQKCHPISGTYRYNSEGDLIIYWTDDLNPPRYLNVTKQKANINILTGTGIENLYGIPPTMDNPYRNEMLKLSPSSGPVPHVSDFQILFGGSLKTGNYVLFLAYEDDKRTRTNYIAYSMPIYITDEPLSKNHPYANDGAVDKVRSGKSIRWEITNINPEYPYLRALVIERHADSEIAYELDRIDITDNSSVKVVTFTGEETPSISSPQEAVLDHMHYSKAKSLEILESVQYAANLESEPTFDYQKYANFIKVIPVIENYPDFDLFAPLMDNNGLNDRDEINIYDFPSSLKSYKNADWATNKKGYMRDEIYALYIAFIKKDGSMTPAYHIPGRAPINSTYPEVDTYAWPQSPLPVYYGGDTRPQDISPDFQNYEFRDYSSDANNPTGMNYWENKDETYPPTDNFDIVDAEFPNVIVGTLRGMNVRHHHFPRNTADDGTLTNYKSIHSWLDSTTTSAYYTYETYTGHAVYESLEPTWYGHDTAWLSSTNRTCCVWEGAYPGGWCECGPDSGNPCPWSMGFTSQIPTDQGTILSNTDVIGQTITFTGCGTGTTHTATVTGITTSSSGNKAFQISPDFPQDGQPNSQNMWDFFANGGGGRKLWDSSGNGVQSGYNSYNWEITIATYHPSTTTINGFRQDVNLLGFRLEDVKIPEAFAKDFQGFRIYRAKRKKSDKTILGQAPMIPMIRAAGYRYSNYNNSVSTWLKVPCRAETFENGHAVGTGFTTYNSNLLDSDPPYYNIEDSNSQIIGSFHGVSFHDFGMLKHQTSLIPATHFHMQYNLEFDVHQSTNHSWTTATAHLGPWGAYVNQNDIYNTSAGVLLFGKDYQQPAFAGAGIARSHPHFITESAKAYAPSRALYKPEGSFGADYIHNIGGETSMVFKLANPSLYHSNPVTDGDYGTTVDTSASGTAPPGSSFVGDQPTNVTYLDIANLKAVKRNVYNSFDDQELEWTGYEVVGNEFQRFIAQDGGGSYGAFYSSNPVFTTDTIFGGDTFISRYAFRSTWDSNADAWAMNGDAEWAKACSYRALYSVIVETTDNINYRHSTGSGTAFFPLYSAKNLLYSLEGACLNQLDYRVTTGEDIAYMPNSQIAPGPNTTTSFMGESQDGGSGVFDPSIFRSCAILDLTAPIGSVHPGNISQALTIATGAPEGIMYNTAYSQGMDIKTPIPYPKYFTDYTTFPTRVIRSLPDSGIEDSLRIFYPSEYIDLDKSKGEINSIFSLDNLLYIHAEDTLLKTKGKQKMQTSEGVADIGSGDIFAQTPEEVIQTTKGYAGSSHMFAGKVTSYGYIWLDYRSRNIFRMTEKIESISDFGLSKWFQDNIPHALEDWGMNTAPEKHTCGIGFHSTIDHVYNRYILTKLEPVPNQYFLTHYIEDEANTVNLSIMWREDSNCFATYTAFYDRWDCIDFDNTMFFDRKDWTISFQLDGNYWASYHDYIPTTFISTRSGIFGASWDMSIINQGNTTNTTNLYEHDVMFAGLNTYTSFYSSETPHMFHFEFVANEQPALDKGFFNFTYTVDTRVGSNIANSIPKAPDHSTGFTSFFLYNHTQMSDLTPLQNLVNIRKVGGSWKVNNFRDMAQQTLDMSNPSVGSNTPLPSLTVPGTWISSPTNALVIENGMNVSPNAGFLNLGLPWNEQKRFTGKYLNIHLISDNTENNLLTLHDAVVGAKPYMR